MKVRELFQGSSLDIGKDSSIQLSSETLNRGRPQVPQVALVGTLKPTGCLMDSRTMPEGHWPPPHRPPEGEDSYHGFQKSFLGMDEIRPPSLDFSNSSPSLRNPSTKYSWMGILPLWTLGPLGFLEVASYYSQYLECVLVLGSHASGFCTESL